MISTGEKIIRLFFSLCIWGLSGIAVFGSLALIRSALEGNKENYAIATTLLLAWIAFFIMNFGWILNKKTPRLVTVSGAIMGLLSLIQFPIGGVWAIVTILSACYFVYFHESIIDQSSKLCEPSNIPKEEK